jgi:hypothetical protein
MLSARCGARTEALYNRHLCARIFAKESLQKEYLVKLIAYEQKGSGEDLNEKIY